MLSRIITFGLLGSCSILSAEMWARGFTAASVVLTGLVLGVAVAVGRNLKEEFDD